MREKIFLKINVIGTHGNTTNKSFPLILRPFKITLYFLATQRFILKMTRFTKPPSYHIFSSINSHTLQTINYTLSHITSKPTILFCFFFFYKMPNINLAFSMNLNNYVFFKKNACMTPPPGVGGRRRIQPPPRRAARLHVVKSE